MGEYVWGPAEVSFPDWQGNAQIDAKMTGGLPLYDITGIDPDEWFIIGLDFGGGESGYWVAAIAVPDEKQFQPHLSERSEIRATKIHLHDVDPFELLRGITHVADIRLRVRSTLQAEILITEDIDLPPQG